jgi:hypothetical protein
MRPLIAAEEDARWPIVGNNPGRRIAALRSSQLEFGRQGDPKLETRVRPGSPAPPPCQTCLLPWRTYLQQSDEIPVGSKQRSVWLTPLQLLLERVAKMRSEDPELDRLYDEASRYTIERFEAASSPVVTDGEQRRYHNFATYCVHGLPNTASDGFKILFSDGQTRRLLRFRRGPFRYMRYADGHLDRAMRYAAEPWLIQLQQKS